MNQSAVRAPRSAARSWRMRAWPSDGTVAHLIFLDHQYTPTADEIAGAVEHARRKGARAIRTSAMFPDSAAVVLELGFEPIDRLALLRLDLGDPTPTPAPDRRHRIGRLRPWHYATCSRIDREAFGLMWGNSPTSLRDVTAATPAHHARVARSDRSIVGFAISGAASATGYLQRLAVTPDHHRRGVATDLVADALTWMRRRRLANVLVNTGVENAAALALYRSFGFEALGDELTIAERHLA